jgi:hypothetical protein
LYCLEEFVLQYLQSKGRALPDSDNNAAMRYEKKEIPRYLRESSKYTQGEDYERGGGVMGCGNMGGLSVPWSLTEAARDRLGRDWGMFRTFDIRVHNHHIDDLAMLPSIEQLVNPRGRRMEYDHRIPGTDIVLSALVEPNIGLMTRFALPEDQKVVLLQTHSGGLLYNVVEGLEVALGLEPARQLLALEEEAAARKQTLDTERKVSHDASSLCMRVKRPSRLIHNASLRQFCDTLTHLGPCDGLMVLKSGPPTAGAPTRRLCQTALVPSAMAQSPPPPARSSQGTAALQQLHHISRSVNCPLLYLTHSPRDTCGSHPW